MAAKKEEINNEGNDTLLNEYLELVHSGEDYFNRLASLIAEAKTEIHIQTYIFENDSTGIKIADLLKAAAARNVKIHILLDGYGSSSLSNKFIKEFTACGISIRFFSPFLSTNNFYIGRRLHHKIVVADSHISLIGGINIGDRYHGSEKEKAWLDYAVEIESTEIAVHLQHLCTAIYYKKKRKGRKKNNYLLRSVQPAAVRILQNDWLKRKNNISKSYIQAIRKSEEEVIIVGSYFLPGRKFTRVLKTASQRGVKIKLILSGISDLPLIKRATGFLYTSLLQYNIELYEWNQSVLHGKVAVVDKTLTTIGSFNLNHLSSYGSIELNAEIEAAGFSENLTLHLYNIIEQCEHITLKTIKERKGMFTDFLNWMSYRFLRVALIIATYLPKKRFYRRKKKNSFFFPFTNR